MFKNFQQSRILEDDFDNKLNCARFNALTVTSIFSFLILCVQDGGRDVDFGFSATLRVPLMFHTLILFHWNKKVDAPAFSLKKAKLSVLNWIWGLQHRINWKFAAVQILIFIRESRPLTFHLSFISFTIVNALKSGVQRLIFSGLGGGVWFSWYFLHVLSGRCHICRTCLGSLCTARSKTYIIRHTD